MTSVDIAEPRWRVDGVTYLRHDLTLPLGDLIDGPVRKIFNLAAVHTTPGHPDWEYFWANVLGATHVCDFARSKGVNELLFTSSISVYGPTEEAVDESSPLRPESAYGKSKLCAEEIHRQWHNEQPAGRKLTIVRPAVIFGREERGNFTRMTRMLARNRFVFPGRTDTIKSCGYVKDLVESMFFAMDRAEPTFTYNFAYPERHTSKDIADAMAEVGGYKKAERVVPKLAVLGAGQVFEGLDRVGVKTGINRARVMKLNLSTNVVPEALVATGFRYSYDLKSALADWKKESKRTDFD